MRPARTAIAAALILAGQLVTGCGGDTDGRAVPSVTASAAPASSPARPLSPDRPGPGFYELSLEWNGQQRSYLLDAPADFDPAEPTPLIVVLHGAPSSSRAVRTASRMDALAQRHGVLVAYPQGWQGRWNAAPATLRTNDVGFLTAVVDSLVAEWNADPDRVYAAGISAGAGMVYRLALEAPDVFAAVAPVSGNLTDVLRPSTELAAPVSVVGFVGLNDTGVVRGDSLGRWRDWAGCAAGQPSPVAGAGHVTRTAADCPDGSQVVEFRIEGMGHRWPSPEQDGFDANEGMWEAFTAAARAG